MATADDLLNVERGELGYSRWNDPEQGTKYGRWYAELTGDSYFGESGVPYCAMFQSWCLAQVSVPAAGMPGAYCPSILSAARNAGALVYNEDAQPGDLLLFDWGGDGNPDHIGCCEVNHPDGSYMETIEGNTNNGVVARRTRSYGNIIGVIRPQFDGGSTPVTPSDPDGQISEDGYPGALTITKAQTQAGTLVDGCVSDQPAWICSQPGIMTTGAWHNGSCTYGSDLVRAIQAVLGVTQDGFFGLDTWHALEDRYGFDHDSVVSSPSNTMAKWQHELNEHSFFGSQNNPTPSPAPDTNVTTGDCQNGIDIASYQSGIDLSVVPCDFVIVKASQGTGYVNPDFDRAFTQGVSCGKHMGIYHYAGGQDARSEASHFISTIRSCGAYNGSNAILVLDWEGEQNGVFGSGSDADWVWAFRDEVHSQTGIWIFVYASKSVMGTFGLGAQDLWVAQYASMNEVDGYQSSPWNEGAYDCAIRQYTSEGRLDGWGAGLDLNKSYMDAATWEARAKGESVPTPTTGADFESEVRGVMSGQYGNGDDRRNALGADYDAVQAEVNHRLTASVDDLANEVIAGRYGNGDDRKAALGSRYEEVQARVNELA
jgi:GH25 family lysozyme M1 (1,4-beta-N-acetylmuramidase)